MDIPGVANLHDRALLIRHPGGAEVLLTEYNQEITGCSENAGEFPILGEHIHYGGNAYYVAKEATRLGWEVRDVSPEWWTPVQGGK